MLPTDSIASGSGSNDHAIHKAAAAARHMSCVIGVDGGTESLRAGVFDLEGVPLAFAATPYKTAFPRPGRAEQNPEDWWQALGASVREAVAKAGVAPDSVAAIALDTTCCSVVALGPDGRPLRPALIWMDVRAAEQAARVAACGDPVLKINAAGHGPVSAEWMTPKALWLHTHERGIYDAATTLCEYQDYLNFRLTGRMVASINNAATRWHYDSRNGGFQQSLADAVGAPDLIGKFPPEVLPLGEVIGGLTAEAAEHLALPAGIPVAQGGADAEIGMIGLGVVRPGKLALITGSSHLHLGLADTPFHAPGIWGTYADALIPGLHVVEGGQVSTGSVVSWFKRLLDKGWDYERLTAEAENLPPGADGLIVQDHFQGNRTPYTDPHSRGVISGLTLGHGPAHIFRAIIEGIAYGTELILETMRNAGYTPDEIVICGGPSRHDIWLRVHADVSGVPLTTTKVPDAPALGSAILAAVGAGVFPDIASAADAMVHVEGTVEPDAGHHEAYGAFYAAYRDTYPALKDVLHRQTAAAGH